MLIAHKIALAPNNAQRNYLVRAAGTARFAYNSGPWPSGNGNTRLGRLTTAFPGQPNMHYVGS